MEGSSVNTTVTVTEDEKNWVKRLSKGESARQVAKGIKMNYNTFAYRLTSLRDKFQCKNTGELIAFFIRQKLID